jgi:hypothetical protein
MTNNDLQNTTQKSKYRATRTPLKTNNDLQNTTQKSKYRATRTPLKTNNDLQNTTQKSNYRATRTPLKTCCDLSLCFIMINISFRTPLPNILVSRAALLSEMFGAI